MGGCPVSNPDLGRVLGLLGSPRYSPEDDDDDADDKDGEDDDDDNDAKDDLEGNRNGGSP